MKTVFQKRTEKRHDKVVELYKQLDDAGWPRSAIFEALSNRTGYTRQGLYLILRKRGVNYKTKNKND